MPISSQEQPRPLQFYRPGESLKAIDEKMTDEERPPTQEEISELRDSFNQYITDNGSGRSLRSIQKVILNYLETYFLDTFHPKDVERIHAQDDYVSRFFMHTTDIPGDHMKNTLDMIVRSFKYRLERNVRGKCTTKNHEALLSLTFLNRFDF